MLLWCVLYLASLYAVQLAAVGPVLWEGFSFHLELFLGLTLLSLALGVAGICLAAAGVVRGGRDPGAERRLRWAALALKLLTIPFFLLHLASWTVVSAAFLVIPGLQVLLLSGFLGVAFAYWVVLVGSACSVGAMYLSLRDGRLTKKRLIWGVLSQLIFVVDVIGCVVFLLCTRKRKAVEGREG